MKRELRLPFAMVLPVAMVVGLPACGSSADSPKVDAAAPDVAGEAGATTDFCTGVATSPLIDDMSGTSISFEPPACGSKGAWFTNPLTTATFTTPAGNGALLGSCGSLCQSFYRPMPAGFPGTATLIDGGAFDAGGLDAGANVDGGASGLQAMCMAGQTGIEEYAGAGAIVGFAFTGAIPATGLAWIKGTASGATTVPPPALIDASRYRGVEFWLWVSPATLAEVDAGLTVQLHDRKQLLGGGTCDPSSSGGRACMAASASVGGGQGEGPLHDDDGRMLTALVSGWQHVRAPWSSFLTNPGYGGLNETSVDPTALVALQLYVSKSGPVGVPTPFNLCVYQLRFY